MTLKLPRPNTRVRALYDELYESTEKYGGSVWGPLKAAYDNAAPAYSNNKYGARYHSNMEISKLLRKFATKSGNAGSYLYTMKSEWLLANPKWQRTKPEQQKGNLHALGMTTFSPTKQCHREPSLTPLGLPIIDDDFIPGCEHCAECTCESDVSEENENELKKLISELSMISSVQTKKIDELIKKNEELEQSTVKLSARLREVSLLLFKPL